MYKPHLDAGGPLAIADIEVITNHVGMYNYNYGYKIRILVYM